MEKEIEKAIRETLVIGNPQSINIAVDKILLLFADKNNLKDKKDFKCSNCDFETNSLDSLGWHKSECKGK